MKQYKITYENMSSKEDYMIVSALSFTTAIIEFTHVNVTIGNVTFTYNEDCITKIELY